MKRRKAPLREGLFTQDAEGAALLADMCNICGQIFFPIRERCLDCPNQDMEPVLLRGTCRLYTFTIVNMPTEHYDPPYAIGWVEFPEGVRVFGQIEGWERQPLKIGMNMKLVIDTLWQEDDREIIGYKFRPLSEDDKR
ncbi:MAG: OB-fold domain-containing protein [Dehalococcoidia bacterium]